MTETESQRLKRICDVATDCGFAVGVLTGLQWTAELSADQTGAIDDAIAAIERIAAATWKREAALLTEPYTL